MKMETCEREVDRRYPIAKSVSKGGIGIAIHGMMAGG